MTDPHKAMGVALAQARSFHQDDADRFAAIMAQRDADWLAWRRDNPGASPLRMVDKDGLTWAERGGQ